MGEKIYKSVNEFLTSKLEGEIFYTNNAKLQIISVRKNDELDFIDKEDDEGNLIIIKDYMIEYKLLEEGIWVLDEKVKI